MDQVCFVLPIEVEFEVLEVRVIPIRRVSRWLINIIITERARARARATFQNFQQMIKPICSWETEMLCTMHMLCYNFNC